MPKPVKVHGVVSCDRLKLDAAYEDWKATRAGEGNTMHALLGRLEQRPAPTKRPAPTRRVGIYDALDAQNGKSRDS